MALTFSLHPCEFEKEVAGTSNIQDSAFQEALLKRVFPKTSDLLPPAGKIEKQSIAKIRALTTGNAHTKIREILQAAVL